MKKLLLVLVTVLFIASCKEDEPLLISPYGLQSPSSPAQINRDMLLQNNSFLTGYLNGTIRSTKATIGWKISSDNDFLCYKIIRNNTRMQDIVDASVNTFTDSLLTQNSAYLYTIATVLKNGVSKIDTVTIRTPRFLSPTIYQSRADSSGSIFLNWTNRAESGQKFFIDRKISGASDSSYLRVGENNAADTSYYDISVTSRNWYVYRLTAWNPYEQTPFSTSTSVLYNMDSASLNSASQIGTSRSVRLTFTDNSNAESGFKIYRKLLYGSYSLIGTAPPNSYQYDDNDTAASLNYDSTFVYKIDCYNNRHAKSSNERSVMIRFNGPRIVFSPASIQFPATSANIASTRQLTIQNTGTQILSVASLQWSNPVFSSTVSSFTVSPGSSYPLVITFRPTAVTPYNATLVLTHNAAGSPSTINLSGTGSGAQAMIDLTPADIQFAQTTVGSSSSTPVTVRNTGSSLLTVSNVASSNPRFTSNVTNFTLSGGSTRTITISFAPSDSVLQNGVITFTSDAVAGNSTVNVSGKGVIVTSALNEGFEGGTTLPAGWTASGGASWFVTSNLPYAGIYCAQSGVIPNISSTSLSTTLSYTGSRTISFRYKVSSEAGFDYLRFYINGVQYGSWSGAVGWSLFSTSYFGSGSVQLTWTYSKDSGGTSGSDAAWIDNAVVQ